MIVMTEVDATDSTGPSSLDPFTAIPRSALQSHHVPEALEPLRTVAMEVEARPSRKSEIEVLEYEPRHDDQHLLLAKPGTVTLYLAKRGAEVLSEVRRLAFSGGSDRLLAARLMSQFDKRTVVPMERAAELLTEQPVFASVRYHGRTLAQSLFVPDDLDVCIVPMAYNGGTLSLDEFTLVEHVMPGADTELEAVALRHSPPLSPAERAALAAVPDDQCEWNVTSPMMCYALTGVTIVATVIAATSFCYQITKPAEDEPAISDEEIAAIGPSATARKLLAIRRQILEKG
jgi:hypothetical protein